MYMVYSHLLQEKKCVRVCVCVNARKCKRAQEHKWKSKEVTLVMAESEYE